MNVRLLVITHNRIGEEIITTALSILRHRKFQVESISIPSDLEPQYLGEYADKVKESISSLSLQQGLLVLTDMYGATPNNLARYFAADCQAIVVSGLNLPMLIRVLNYVDKTLEELCTIAIEGVKKSAVRDDQI